MRGESVIVEETINNPDATAIEMLKKDQLIFQKILDISADGFLIVDDKGNILEINKAYCNWLGRKREDIVGKYVLDVIKNSKLPEILITGETEVDVLHKLADGQSPSREKYVAVARAPVIDGDRVIAAVGQIKFSRETLELAEKLQHIGMELQYYKNELRRLVGSQYSFDTMIGCSKKFMEMKALAQKAAVSDFSVLITGETGTGKEVFANAIHQASERRHKPFIRINCAAIPGELMEAELFGYEEGSFTGARKGGKKGKFELANGGTVFLDEVGDMPLAMQAKLLRALQEKEVEKVGGYHPVPIDVRVIAATNQNLEERIKSKTFRPDLFYRLNVIQVRIPPLRERPEDIPLFVEYFLDDLKERYGKEVAMSPEAARLLAAYAWPGNIRELKNVIERAYSMVDGNVILSTHMPANILSKTKASETAAHGRSLDSLLEEIEKEILLTVLRKNQYNYRATAKELGVHRSTLYKKLEKFNIDRGISGGK
jgi:PAS domain S-box-containing protein